MEKQIEVEEFERLDLKKATIMFQANFTRLFKEWGKSQGVLSKLLGVNQSRISYWLHGLATPSYVNLYNLSRVFGVELSEFYEEI